MKANSPVKNLTDKTSNERKKSEIRTYWETETCGTRYGESTSRKEYFDEIERTRYTLEPYIPEFAGFHHTRGKKVLEIGVGAGTDFQNWVRNGATATGIDLTDRAIQLTRERLELNGIDLSRVDLRRADTENLPFEDGSFDIVYSWGVLHVPPDTEKAFREVYRVMKSGGTLKAMVYHLHSWTSWLMWSRYSLLRGQPWQSVREAVFQHLESPGTKVYTTEEAKKLVETVGFADVRVWTRLGPADLLEIKPSFKYQHSIDKLAWRLYPRRLVRALGDRFGLYLLIEGRKP